VIDSYVNISKKKMPCLIALQEAVSGAALKCLQLGLNLLSVETMRELSCLSKLNKSQVKINSSGLQTNSRMRQVISHRLA
jgi:hypothetical protein